MSQIDENKKAEQLIAKNIQLIGTQIENMKATRINTEQLTAVIKSSNAQVRHIQRHFDELSEDEIKKVVEQCPDWRFGQVLFNLGIVSYNSGDVFFDESVDILQRMKSTIGGKEDDE